MPIEWIRTSDYFVDCEPTDTDFVALDGYEIVGNVARREGGRQAGWWEWSVSIAIGRRLEPKRGVEPTLTAAARRVLQAYTANTVQSAAMPRPTLLTRRGQPRVQ